MTCRKVVLELPWWLTRRWTSCKRISKAGHAVLTIFSILHGGAILDTATDSDTPTTLLAFLNTTTWAWSTPSNLQPPASSAASYHSSVMTTSGVMITAFGLGSDGSPRSDVFYLDMRDPTGSSWSWKSYWNKQMLGAYAGTSNTVTTGTSATNGVAATNNSSAPSKKGITTIVVPVIIGLLLALPVIIYFIRRRVRIARKRRLARHFSFSSQEDNGGFSSSLEQFRASRKTKTLFSFGRDANEKDSSLITDIGSGLVSILKRYSGAASSVDGASSRRDRSSKGSKMSEKAMNWEEIDFGLGQVDERRVSATSRRSSFSAPAQSPRTATKTLEPLPFAMPVASTAPGYDPSALFSSSHENMVGPLVVTVNDAFPRVGTPRHDGQMPLVPELAVIPPRAAAQALSTAYPTMAPSPAQADGLDWSMLQQELDAKPVFRSISATSTLRSHAHPRSSSPTSARTVTPPSLPSLEFQRDASQTSSITLVNPKTGRRVSDSLPFSQSPRSVSQPLAGRQLAGNLGRRGSAPFVGNISPFSSGSVTPTGRRASTASVDPVMRRTSNRSVIVTPGSPMLGSKRESTQSRLRVVNVTDDEVAGQAL